MGDGGGGGGQNATTVGDTHGVGGTCLPCPLAHGGGYEELQGPKEWVPATSRVCGPRQGLGRAEGKET